MAAKRASLVLTFLVALALASPSLSAAAHQAVAVVVAMRRRQPRRWRWLPRWRGWHRGGVTTATADHAVPRGAAYHSSPRYGGHGGYSHGGHYGCSGRYGYYGHRGYYGHGHYGHTYTTAAGYYGTAAGTTATPTPPPGYYGGWPYAYVGALRLHWLRRHSNYPAYAAYGDVYAAAPARRPRPTSDVTTTPSPGPATTAADCGSR